MPNFIEIGQTSLEIGGVNWASDNFFVTDGQKRDYFSRASQCARGATKNLYNSISASTQENGSQAGQNGSKNPIHASSIKRSLDITK